ncbi:MAG: hypothetical protein ACLTDV_12655 [Eubacterium sp.]
MQIVEENGKTGNTVSSYIGLRDKRRQNRWSEYIILKKYMRKPERLAPGHQNVCRMWWQPLPCKKYLRALHEGDKAVIGNATGCLEVSIFHVSIHSVGGQLYP